MTAASGADHPCHWGARRCDAPNALCIVDCSLASGADQPTLRDQLAEGLMDARLIRWREPELARKLADALLPLIEADRERAKAEAAAEALEKAAAGISFRAAEEESEGREVVTAALDEESARLYRRAAALRGSTGDKRPDGRS